MKYVEVIANNGLSGTVSAIAEKFKVPDFRLGTVGEDGMQPMRLVVTDESLQGVLDALQTLLGSATNIRVLVLPVEVSLPKPKAAEIKQKDSATATRGALYESVNIKRAPRW